MSTVHLERAGTRRDSVTGWSGRVVATVVVTIFVLFFVIPIVWLLLASGKSARALAVDNPFSPGTPHGLTTNWNQLFDFQDGAVTAWMGNSALYAVGALIITLIAGIPAG